MQTCQWKRALGLLGGLLAMTMGKPTMAGENFALLVAVGDYDPKQLHKLPYSRNDILKFRDALAGSDFPSENLVVMHDDPKNPAAAARLPEAVKIRKQIALLLAGRAADDLVILAFAGHGIQFKGDEASYFCPLDADLEKKETLISFQEVYDSLKSCPARRKLLLVDACRNDPRTGISRSRATVDLESVTRPQSLAVPESVVAFFSCASGQQSFESPDLQHGVFFHHVLDIWKSGVEGQSELTLDDLVAQTRKRTEAFVRTQLSATQTPEIQGKIAGSWVLRKYNERNPAPLPFDAAQVRTSAEARSAQNAWAKHLRRKVETVNSIGMKLRLIPPGTYHRGSVAADVDFAARLDPSFSKFLGEVEQPRHLARLSKPFHMSRTEVTRGQFRRFVSATGYRTEPESDGRGGYGYDPVTGKIDQSARYTWREAGFPQTDEHPVVNVTWNDAVAFTKWLAQEEKSVYRLPTEAEWEYACRAGTTTHFQTGDDEETLAAVGNVADRTAKAKFPHLTAINVDDGYLFTAPAAMFQVNRFGLADMHGNVFEWCQDFFAHDEYSRFVREPAVDSTGPKSGGPRIVRGGSWDFSPAYARSSARYWFDPTFRYYFVGFRVVAELTTTEN